jgi:hypothetical protein
MSQAKKPQNADHVRRKNAPAPSNEVIAARLQSLLTPAILGQQGYARLLGLRERILNVWCEITTCYHATRLAKANEGRPSC